MLATEDLSERIAIFDYTLEYTERALADHRIQAALGSLATELLERAQTAYLPNVNEYGVVSMPKSHMDTNNVAVLPVTCKGGPQFLSPDWFMPPTALVTAAIPKLKDLWPEKSNEELYEAVLGRSLGEHALFDYFSTDILPYFSKDDEFGPIAALLQNEVWSLKEDHGILIKTPPIILLGPITLVEGSGYGQASTLAHELSHVVQDDYLDVTASKISHELFAYRTCSTILKTFASDIDPETLEYNEFSLEVGEMRARVNSSDDPYAEHAELVQLFDGLLIEDDGLELDQDKVQSAS